LQLTQNHEPVKLIVSSFLYNGHWVFPGDKERPGRDADHSPPSSAVGRETVELYLYSPYGSYSLYRASVLVQESTLPLHLSCGRSCPIKITVTLQARRRSESVAPYCNALWLPLLSSPYVKLNYHVA